MARLRELKDTLKRYQAMETHILTGGEEYTVGNTPHRMPPLRVVQRKIKELEKRINRVEGRQRRVAGVDLSLPGGSA